MWKKYIWLLFTLFMSSISMGPVRAGVVTFYFAGEVTQQYNVGPEFSVGMPMVGKVSYDPSASDTAPTHPYMGRYPGALLDYWMNVDGSLYQFNSSDHEIIVVGGSSSSSITIYSRNPDGVPANGMNPVNMEFFIRSKTGIFSSDVLPDQSPDLTLFDWNHQWSITFDSGRHSRGIVIGNISAISNTPLHLPTVTVPEAGIGFMTGLALLLLGLCHRLRGFQNRRQYSAG